MVISLPHEDEHSAEEKKLSAKEMLHQLIEPKLLPKLQIRNRNENNIPYKIKTHLVRRDAIFKSCIQTFFCYCSNYKVWKLIFYPAHIEDNKFYYKNNISEFS